MARGFVWGVYVDDEGTRWAVQVDADYAVDADRGWELIEAEALHPFPRGWLCRRVIGLDEVGGTLYAVAATTDAPIWTMAVPTFTFTGNDAVAHVATIIGRYAEQRRPRP